MAKDIHNEDSEEQKKDKSQQDEDFGLPDLEFEELEELDLNMGDEEESPATPEPQPSSDNEMLAGGDDIDMSVLDDIGDDIAQEPAPVASSVVEDSAIESGIDEIEDVLDSAQLISDRLGDDEDEDGLEISPIADTSNALEDTSAIDISNDDLLSSSDDSLGSVPGMSDAELEALMAPPEPVPDIESMLNEGSTEVDDILASLDTSEESLSATPSEVNSDSDIESSLFSVDEPIMDNVQKDTDLGVSETAAPSVGGSIFESDEISNQGGDDKPVPEPIASENSGGSIFENDSIALDAKPSTSTLDFQPPKDDVLVAKSKPYTYEEATSGNFTRVIISGVIIIGIIGASLLWVFWQSEGDNKGKEIAKTEKVAKKPAKKVKKVTAANEKGNAASNKAKKAAKKPVKKVVKKAAVNTAAPGEIILLKEKTARVYAIVASFIDGDIAMDYAKELSGKGVGVKIIPPYGKSINHRVTVADYASYKDATAGLDNVKSTYGDQVWALKY